ncbi:hypothetical protein DMW56_17250 [Serratia marcescens]|uniref:Uncharacterized protein n=1 Tax=Serratia marcescens TaxID=615 RepID=A0ABX5NFF2_SERMA|nr:MULTISPECIES: hypothetical protein [Serratia]MDI9106544.1 hypothetical protein [Serratia marcescens]MDN0029794.1 hypothetical protein [Serratia marcescens]MDR8492071.1 hypothetical protein [Serratia nevei]PXZ99034.1 hypothetical protein CW300_03255 [Serratia marcescens]PYA13107.1 hypothetical protein DMW42_19535 [Serratia marcescens]
MNNHEKKAASEQVDPWKGEERKTPSSNGLVPLLKDFFAILGFLFTLAIFSYFLFGNIQIGKLSIGHNILLGYYIRYGA